jgi:hypothetical protein
MHDRKYASLPVVALLDRTIVRPEPYNSRVASHETGGFTRRDDAIDVACQQEIVEGPVMDLLDPDASGE